jgi:hypothetical protein
VSAPAKVSVIVGITLCLFCLLLRSDIVVPIAVIDGDTLRRDGVTYRLFGFDAPEIRRAKSVEAEATRRAVSAGVPLAPSPKGA